MKRCAAWRRRPAALDLFFHAHTAPRMMPKRAMPCTYMRQLAATKIDQIHPLVVVVAFTQCVMSNE